MFTKRTERMGQHDGRKTLRGTFQGGSKHHGGSRKHKRGKRARGGKRY